MATHASTRQDRDRGRVPYRFTADEVLRLRAAGIITADVELWDGTLYRMVKKELHNYIVSQVADALRPLIPSGYHLREEKSCRYGARSLPEPDVAVARGRKGDYLPDPPPLARMALLVEVNHHSTRADRGPKLRRYAAVGIPVYWIVEVEARTVVVHERPVTDDQGARFEERTTHAPGQLVPVVIDGGEVGRIAVADLFPPEAPPGPEPTRR